MVVSSVWVRLHLGNKTCIGARRSVPFDLPAFNHTSRSLTGIGDLQSPLLCFLSFARHSFGSANKFAAPNKFFAPSKDFSPLAQNENCWHHPTFSQVGPHLAYGNGLMCDWWQSL